jgi:hypothetical protein
LRSIPPPPRGSCALIAHVVRSEVQAFQKRQHARRLDRVLSLREVERGEQQGKISPEGSAPKHSPAEVVSETAIATALEAFGDGLYLVVIDDVEYTDLDAMVTLKRDSRLTFIRLTFLAGA